MDKKITEYIVNIIINNKDLLEIALKQRAKFEGWLKFELARILINNNANDVRVESPYASSRTNNKYRSDISFKFSGKLYDLELKTPNSNWKIEGIERRTRPITKNIKSIINDVNKLKFSPNIGIVSFVLFPIPYNDNRWIDYLNRISSETNIQLSKEKNCAIVDISINGILIQIVVCSFIAN